MSRAEALRIATEAAPARVGIGAMADLAGLAPGQRVTVAPDDDARVPVVGTLLAADVHEIVIRRSDREVGEVCVHFPRAGFVVASA